MKEIKLTTLKDVRTIAIYGNCGSGKTSLAYHLIDLIKENKKVFFLKHPKPELIEEMGYEDLDSLEQMEKMQDCVLYIDEPQLSLPIYAHKANKIIAQICSLARQLDITLVISSSDTRVFTKANEAYFDLWCVKDLDYDMVKNGSKIKNVLRKNAKFDPSGIRLDKDEFIAECRTNPQINGKHLFQLPNYFTEEYSKPFRTNQIANKIEDQTPNESENESNLFLEKNKQNSEQNRAENSEKEITLQTPAILPAAGPANICEVPRVRIPARGIK